VTELHCSVLVVGGGPGGYSAAIRAGQLGLDAVLVEAAALGGTCLNVGCIPSKALLHVADAYAAANAREATPFGLTVTSAQLDFTQTTSWIASVVDRLDAGVAHLLAGAHVRHIHGWARCVDGKTVVVETHADGAGKPLTITTEHLVLATGSRPVELPALPFGGRVIPSDAMFALDDVPERLVVVGGGYIGIELGTAFAKLGAAVTVVEATARILPGFDDELVRPLSRALTRSGVEVLTATAVQGLSADGTIVVAQRTDGSTVELRADTVLVTVGRLPATEEWGLEELDLERSGPFVWIDGQCRTSMAGVYAIGDLSGEPMLAHRAIAQGRLVAEVIAGRRRGWDNVCVPAVVFTDPEIVSVGLDPTTARASGTEIVVGRFPFSASGRALATDATDGFVRVVARADDHVLLGIQGVGTAISELSAAFALALEMGARLEDVAGTIHAHPTRSEAFPEAVAAALGTGLHLTTP